MTVANKTPSAEAIETGAIVPLDLDFRFSSGGIEASRVYADGSVVALVESVDYVLAGGSTDDGGTLTPLAAAAAGTRLRAKRVTPRTQQTDYVATDAFPAASHEEALDRQMMIAQEEEIERQALANRALLVPDGETVDIQLGSIADGQVLVRVGDRLLGADNDPAGAAASAAAAAISAASAATSELNADTSDSNALGSANAAAASAVAAAASATGAAASQSAAEAARDAAIAGASGVYPDEAAGIAATVGGDFFVVANTLGWQLFENVASVATVRSGIFPTLSALEDFLATSLGEAADTGTAPAVGYSYMNVEGSPINGIVRSIDVRSTATAEATVFTAIDNGGGTVTIVNSIKVYLQNALNVAVPVNLPINEGELVGIHSTGSVRKTGAGDPAYYAAGLIGVGTAVTTDATWGLQLRADIVGVESETIAQVESYGVSQRLGRDAVATTGSTAGSTFALFNYDPVMEDGYITEVEVAVNAISPTATLIVASINAGGTVDLVRSVKIALFAGLNRVKVNGVAVSRGQFVGILANGVKQNNGGKPAFFTTGVPSAGTAKTVLGTYGLQLGVTIATQERAEIGVPGIPQAAATDGTDVTSEFQKARAGSESLFVPPGEYAVTDLRSAGDGLWGPGRIKYNGNRFFIHRAPSFSSLHQQFRSALARQIGDVSGLALLGDSITQATIDVSDWKKAWPVLLTRYANALTSPGDLPAVTAFNTGGAALDLTLPGAPTHGVSGPMANSIILQAGESLSFTGDFDIVDVFYNQQAGAGTLDFKFNGGAAFKTVDCSGATVLDKSTYNGSKTGQTGTSGTYSINCTGGPVEITGLIRLDLETDTFDPRLPVFNFGKNSQSVTALTAARITSLVKHCQVFGGGNVGAIMMFGENDQINTLPDDIYTNVSSAIASLQAAGVKTIWGCGILRPTSTTYVYSAGCSYAGANGAVRAAYQDANIPILPLDTIDFEGLGYVPVHPNDAGQVVFSQMLVESIARSFG